MILTVLGHDGAYPGKFGANPGYLVECGDTKLLLDCGSGVLARLQQICDPRDLNSLILSHLHGDHMSDALSMRYMFSFMLAHGERGPLTVLMPAAPEAEAGLFSSHRAFNVKIITQQDELTLGQTHISFTRTIHPVETYAIKVTSGGRCLFYTADTVYDKALIEAARGADLLLADAAMPEKARTANSPHMSAAQAAILAGQAGVGKLVLTHIFPEYDAAQLLSEATAIFPNTLLAQDMCRYEL